MKAHVDVSSEVRGISYGLCFPLLPYFVYAKREGSGETAHAHAGSPSPLRQYHK